MIYRAMMQMAAPVLRRHLTRRVARGKEDEARLDERYGLTTLPRPAGKLIWCHAASVGEAVALLALVNALLAKYAGAHVLVTTGTLTSAKIMAQRLPAQALHQFTPLDHPTWVNSFLDHWRPDAVIWTESEIWPNFLEAVARLAIPAAMVNGRLSVKSSYRWRLVAASWFARLMETFTVRLAQSRFDAEQFNRLSKGFKTVGNLKFALEAPPVDEAALRALRLAIGRRPFWLAAATHPGEEERALATHVALAKLFPGLLTIIVPRHPDRGGEVAAMIAAAGLTVQRRSEGKLPDGETDIYLGDTLGELGTFYTAAPIAFIGGSFGEGGHNPLESALCGCATVFGWDMRNNHDIAGALKAVDAAVQVGDDPHELSFQIGEWLAEPDKADKVAKAGLDLARSASGVVERIMTELEPVFVRAGLTETELADAYA